jgi:glycosyltransferase involved in cell wall biosynthesis
LLRVAVVLPAYFENELHFAGGGDRYPYRLAQALRAHCDVTLVSFGSRAFEEQLNGLRHVVLPVISAAPDNPVPRLGFFFRERFDLIHVHQVRSATTSLLSVLTRFLRTPLVATDHGGGGRSLMYPLHLYRLIQRFITQSEFSRSLLPPAAQRRATVIRGGIDTDDFAFSAAPRERRAIQVGRIMPHKGIHYLIEAAGSDIPVVVAGRVFDGAYYEHLRQISVGKQVTFLIDANDAAIRDLYATSAVTVAASVYHDEQGRTWPNAELLGLTLLESMSVGTPVVCTKVGGMPEYVVDGQVGFVVPPNDPRELRDKMLSVLSDPQRANAMSQAGRAHVQAFTWQHVAEQVAEEYSRLVKEH